MQEIPAVHDFTILTIGIDGATRRIQKWPSSQIDCRIDNTVVEP